MFVVVVVVVVVVVAAAAAAAVLAVVVVVFVSLDPFRVVDHSISNEVCCFVLLLRVSLESARNAAK